MWLVLATSRTSRATVLVGERRPRQTVRSRISQCRATGRNARSRGPVPSRAARRQLAQWLRPNGMTVRLKRIRRIGPKHSQGTVPSKAARRQIVPWLRPNGMIVRLRRSRRTGRNRVNLRPGRKLLR